jgi:NADH-quinone oxidoreductase subunit M
MPNALSLTILFPLLGALIVALTPRNYRFVIRVVALAATLLTLLNAVFVFTQFQMGVAGYQLVQSASWVPSLGISYKVGVDGINVGLILMGAIVAFASVCVSRNIVERSKEFYFLLMIMIGGILGAFASLDLFFFFFFHELALIPTFIMIGVWGRGDDKNYATFQITLYLTAGALITLIGLIALYLNVQPRTFDIVALTESIRANPLSISTQNFIFPILLFGFGILVSLWPFHSWAPLGYGAAPSATAMLHAGVLKKFGLYGLLRVAFPLMPEAAHTWLHILVWLCVGNIVYNGLVAMRQRDLNLLIGNSSVAHMGFIFLGIASLTLVGVTGAVLIMIAHGLLAALSFAISGHIHQQTGTLNMDRMGGFLKRMPFVGSAFLMAAMAGCGLPGFANFVGEAMALFAAWNKFSIVTSIAVWGGLVIGAIYMLRAVRSILHGPLPAEFSSVIDAQGWWRKLPFALLFGTLLLFGIWPRALTDKIKPSAELIVKMANPTQGTAIAQFDRKVNR